MGATSERRVGDAVVAALDAARELNAEVGVSSHRDHQVVPAAETRCWPQIVLGLAGAQMMRARSARGAFGPFKIQSQPLFAMGRDERTDTPPPVTMNIAEIAEGLTTVDEVTRVAEMEL